MQRQLNGVLILDKPEDMSSAQLVTRIKSITGAKKAGHTGTLDPFATGVMVCCLNQATRLAQFLLKGPKSYLATLRLGVETDTQDHTGSVTARSETTGLTETMVRDTLRSFVGEMDQLPPMFSALKHKGTPLYKLARKGKGVQKPPRRVEIASIDILDIALPDVRFAVSCSAGTYIRTLCADIGNRLGCGGHLAALRRTASCEFGIERAVTLEELSDIVESGRLEKVMVHMPDALPRMDKWVADGAVLEKIKYGRPLSQADMGNESADTRQIQVVDAGNRLHAIIGPSQTAGQYDYYCVFHNEDAE
ncbi:MAG: tRNA pseudouridine(55) synthase TruB [Desulfobacteraceae bacterium]|nr:tRNA pseudouridine(55) synthase TruB [Desulfobacteraceae bacterium]